MRSLSSIFAVVLISIVSKMFFQKISEDKNEAALQNENLLSEMKFLKSQVNPHFLFNALNNIYTLVLLKKDAAPAVLKSKFAGVAISESPKLYSMPTDIEVAPSDLRNVLTL